MRAMGIAQGPISVVERGGRGERGVLLGLWFGGEAVGMQLARLGVEGLLERGEIDVQVRGEAELREVRVLQIVARVLVQVLAHQVSRVAVFEG